MCLAQGHNAVMLVRLNLRPFVLELSTVVLIVFCFCEWLRGTRHDGIVAILPGPL